MFQYFLYLPCNQCSFQMNNMPDIPNYSVSLHLPHLLHVARRYLPFEHNLNEIFRSILSIPSMMMVRYPDQREILHAVMLTVVDAIHLNYNERIVM